MTVTRRCRFHPLAPSLLSLALLAALTPAQAQRDVSTRKGSGALATREKDPRYDPRATQLLKKMGEAYAHMGALDLHIDISSMLIPIDDTPDAKAKSDVADFQVDEIKMQRQGKLHLAFQPSNRLLIESEQTNALTHQAYDLRWVSDGQSFWSYTGEKKIYTREKAPGSIHDFARLKYLSGGMFELLMLIGPSPFDEILENVDRSRRIGEANIRGIATEVVSIETTDPIEQAEMRLYIGRDDALLYRTEIRSIPVIPHQGPIKVGSKLDALLEANQPPPVKQEDMPDIPTSTPSGEPVPEPPKPQKPSGSFTRFENMLDLRPSFPPGTFAFTPPKGSLMMGEQPPGKHLTPKQKLEEMAKQIRKRQADLRRNAQKDEKDP